MKEIDLLYRNFLSSEGVATDTRQDVNGKMYFALSGNNFDGNKFASDAIENGAACCVIDNPDFKLDNRYIVVKNTLEALQKMAHHHRKTNKTTVLAITGSNGKTTTKELITSVLSGFKNTISTSGNFNNHIGVPLSLLKIKERTEIAIIEMGANHIGEIDSLCKIAEPDVGIITNIGKAHLEGFGSFQGVITTKNELYNYLNKRNGHVIVNISDPLLNELSENISRTTYGINNADVEGEIISSIPFLTLKWECNNIVSECRSRLYGNYNFTNILAAITTGVYFNVENDVINTSIQNYVSQNNRSQLIKSRSNRIILDAYNANPYSMNEAIISFSENNFENPWLFLGDMFELGEYSNEEHTIIVNKLINSGFENVVLIGHEFNSTSYAKFMSFNTTDEAIDFLKNNRINDSDILIKGSRGMMLEKLLKYL